MLRYRQAEDQAAGLILWTMLAPARAEAFGLDEVRGVAEVAHVPRHLFDKRRWAANEDARLQLGREARFAQQGAVDAAPETGPSGRLQTGERVRRGKAVPRPGQPVEFGAIDDILSRARRIQ